MATSDRNTGNRPHQGANGLLVVRKTAGRGRVSDQQAGEQGREIEKRQPGWRRLSDDLSVSCQDWRFELWWHKRGREAARHVSTGLSGRSCIARRAEIATATARDFHRLPTVVLLRLTNRMPVLGERGSARRCHHCEDQNQSREPLGQT